MSEFPERLRLRDTKLFDDLGGAGQRIFTTAGQGYEKQEYVRADVHKAEIERLTERLEVAEIDRFEQQQEIGETDAEIKRLRAKLTEYDGMLGKRPCQNNRCMKFVRLQEALEYYADRRRYDNSVSIDRGDGSHDYSTEILEDEGAIARATLNFTQAQTT